MAVKRGGLGKGVDTLIPEVKNSPIKSREKVEKEVKKVEQMVRISKVEPNREQPRRHFEEDAFNNGVLDKELFSKDYAPSEIELKGLKEILNIELDKLLE